MALFLDKYVYLDRFPMSVDAESEPTWRPSWLTINLEGIGLKMKIDEVMAIFRSCVLGSACHKTFWWDR